MNFIYSLIPSSINHQKSSCHSR